MLFDTNFKNWNKLLADTNFKLLLMAGRHQLQNWWELLADIIYLLLFDTNFKFVIDSSQTPISKWYELLTGIIFKLILIAVWHLFQKLIWITGRHQFQIVIYCWQAPFFELITFRIYCWTIFLWKLIKSSWLVSSTSRWKLNL